MCKCRAGAWAGHWPQSIQDPSQVSWGITWERRPWPRPDQASCPGAEAHIHDDVSWPQEEIGGRTAVRSARHQGALPLPVAPDGLVQEPWPPATRPLHTRLPELLFLTRDLQHSFLAPHLRSAEPLDMYSFLTMVEDLPAESGPPLELTMGNKVRLADVIFKLGTWQ